jgi:hypothetical protein
MTDEQFDQAREEIHELFEEVREALAEDLGGEPEDYRADEVTVGNGDDA